MLKNIPTHLIAGPLGAGKTSIARGLLAALGLEGEAPSPSYAIVQPYDPPEVAFPVLHVDLYRIDDPDEAEELGLEDARGDSLLLVEWPERGKGVLPPADLRIQLSLHGGGRRARLVSGTQICTGRKPAARRASRRLLTLCRTDDAICASCYM